MLGGSGGGLQYSDRRGSVSLEEIMGDLHATVLGTAVVSSATSWMVLHLVLGDDPLFHVPAYRLVHPAEFAIYAALGVVGGLGSAAFVKLLLGLRRWFKGFSLLERLVPAGGRRSYRGIARLLSPRRDGRGL